MTHKIVLIHSKPGLGKTTLAKSVVTALNGRGVTANHFSMGDTLRGILDGSIPSRFAGEVRRYGQELAHHQPVPDGELTADIVGEFCDQSAAAGIQLSVIDGYPRYELLFPAFERLCQEREIEVLLVVVIDGDDELAAERIMARGRHVVGVAENAAARLQDYSTVSAPIVARLAANYASIRIDAYAELGDKTAQVVAAVTARLATR